MGACWQCTFFSYDLFLTERTEWHPKLANKLVSEKQAVHVHKVCLVFLWRKFESTRRDGATCSRHTKKSRIWALHQLSIVTQRLQWDKCTSSGGGWGRWHGVRVGGHASWSTNDLDTFRPAPEWTRSLFDGCLFVVLCGPVWPFSVY